MPDGNNGKYQIVALAARYSKIKKEKKKRNTRSKCGMCVLCAVDVGIDAISEVQKCPKIFITLGYMTRY